MYGLFKKYIVPHPENGHMPHILRVETVLVMLAAVFAAEVLFLTQVLVLGKSGMLASIVANVLIDRTNDARLAERLPALAVNPALERAAVMKAEDMAGNGYFAHTSPAGVTPWHWFREAGYRYLRAGENLAVNFADSEDVVAAWMNSPKHRENIENAKYTDIGIGTARGMHQGKETTFIVQLFGLPMSAAVPETVGSGVVTPTFRPVAVLNENDEPEMLPEPAEVAGAAAQGERASPEDGRESQADNAVVVSGIAEIETQLPPGRTGETKRYANLLERLVSSPRAVAQTFYLALATLVALALTFVFFLCLPAVASAEAGVHVSHPHLVKHGVIFLVIIGAVVLVNHYIALASARVF